MSAGLPAPLLGAAVLPVVDVVSRLDPYADRAVVAAVATQLTADPSRLVALRADLAAHPEYLTGGSSRSQDVTQEFARALFAVGVRGVALPPARGPVRPARWWCGCAATAAGPAAGARCG